MSDKQDGGIDPRITEAIEFMHRVSENDTVNRERAKYWRRFRWGEQWPAEIQNSRMLENRPCITVNKTDTFCRQVANNLRKQRPRIKVDPGNDQANRKTADLLKGMIRHIEGSRSGADAAYDTGADCALTEGVGYWRVMADYTADDSFEQELYLMPVEDPSTVYFDDHCVMPDGSDNEQTLIAVDMGKKAFRSQYPDADDGAAFQSTETSAGWNDKDTIRVGEYYRIKRTIKSLYNIGGVGIWADDERLLAMDQVLLATMPKRNGVQKEVTWCKLTAMEVLDERVLPGKYIPVIRCNGETAIVDGKKRRAGLVKNAEGPQQMSNFWKTAMTESVAMAPKAKWVMAEGQDEGHEIEWATANVSTRASLRYKPTDVAGTPAPPPIRIQPEPPPEGAMAMAQSVDQDLTAVLGIVDPAMRIGGNVSGKALQAERLQSDNSTFNFSDELTRAVGFTGRVFIDLMPFYYFEPGRVVRIIGDDGKSETDTINTQDDEGKTLHDISQGRYEVVMDAGPGYETSRQEARDAMTPLFERNEELMKVAGDVYFRSMDYQGAEVIADRLAAANPMSQIDDKSPIQPQVQMRMKAQQMQIQQLEQALQAAEMDKKYRLSGEQMKQEGATRRELMKGTASLHVENAENEAWMRDTDIKAATARYTADVGAQASLSVAEINAVRDLLKTKVNNEHDMKTLDKTVEHEDKQLAKKEPA